MKPHHTVTNYLSALRHLHVFCHFHTSAFDDIHVKLTQNGLEKSMVHLPRPKAPLTPAILLQFYHHPNICDSAHLVLSCTLLVSFFSSSELLTLFLGPSTSSPLIKSCLGAASLLPVQVPFSRSPAPRHVRPETPLSWFQFLEFQDPPSAPQLPYIPCLTTTTTLTLFYNFRKKGLCSPQLAELF